jgi:MoxR-like ATPase
MTAPPLPPDSVAAADGMPSPAVDPRRPVEGWSAEVVPPARARAMLERLQASVGSQVIGSEPVVRALTIALVIEGHVLVEGVPGIAKTMLARAYARALGLSFQRIQFTPDMLPSDILGSLVLDPRDRSFVYRSGPIFANLVLADEINRAPAKVQSALLEAMQERQVTIDRETHRLPRPFLVIATENPLEQEGTYPLPEAELDRFVFRWIMSYPSEDEERTIVRSQLNPPGEANTDPVLSAEEIARLPASLSSVHVEDAVVRYATEIVRATRVDAGIAVGASPRAAVQFMRAARASAFLSGRGYVTPDDVKELAFATLNHRVRVRSEFRNRRLGDAAAHGPYEAVRTILRDCVSQVPAPR